MAVKLNVDIAGMKLKNPLIAASGTCGYGNESKESFDITQFGAITTKTITLEPRHGNNQPRLLETPSGLLNSIGLQNIGCDAFESDVLPDWDNVKDVGFIVSIGGNDIDDYVALCRKLDSSKRIDAFEINISCPNVKSGCLAIGTDEALTTNLIKRLKEVNEEFKKQLKDKKIEMRIGIDTGEVSTARLGAQNAPIDVFGKVAEKAEKLEQKGKTGHIKMSKATKKALGRLLATNEKDSSLIPTEFNSEFFDPSDEDVQALKKITRFNPKNYHEQFNSAWKQAANLVKKYNNRIGADTGITPEEILLSFPDIKKALQKTQIDETTIYKEQEQGYLFSRYMKKLPKFIGATQKITVFSNGLTLWYSYNEQGELASIKKLEDRIGGLLGIAPPSLDQTALWTMENSLKMVKFLLESLNAGPGFLQNISSIFKILSIQRTEFIPYPDPKKIKHLLMAA